MSIGLSYSRPAATPDSSGKVMLAGEIPTFSVHETHGRVLRPENRVIAQSPDVGWRFLYAAILEEGPFDATEGVVDHPSLIYHLAHPTEIIRQIGGSSPEKLLIGPRQICITPGAAITQWRHSGYPQILQVYLRQSIYDAVVAEMYGCDPRTAEVVPRFAMIDPLLEQLALAIRNSLFDSMADDRLYVEMLAQTLAAHLARFHCTRSRPTRSVSPDVISAARMRRLIDYIEEHLDGNLSLEALAAQIDVHQLRFAKAFKVAIGKPPHQYVLSRRLERAKDLLKNTGVPIANIALDCGFCSQSHLSTWFARAFGKSPSIFRHEFRKRP
jgi:AraC family transcriptional regulator